MHINAYFNNRIHFAYLGGLKIAFNENIGRSLKQCPAIDISRGEQLML